ncbi:hypothetical protein BN903_21 [Halorubrum sp. AJ67]|nr:hypothetical protein BN903_21 [Halorubrum sp. AJ67]
MAVSLASRRRPGRYGKATGFAAAPPSTALPVVADATGPPVARRNASALRAAGVASRTVVRRRGK